MFSVLREQHDARLAPLSAHCGEESPFDGRPAIIHALIKLLADYTIVYAVWYPRLHPAPPSCLRHAKSAKRSARPSSTAIARPMCY
ncbi:hypothetical protein BB8028_0001g00510 [Beauveria bassiana]|uniref:Uncharacterized protein n=1 Tax=Beauveria bassiana TaxID=176275 RepID=A0A2S7XVL1_BEABA|nr:hypothetical protein BB8028_0001g00510 [Beauveria bassiana]